MEEDPKKVRSKLKKFRKCSRKSKIRKRDNLSDSTNDSWSVGFDSTGELVHVAHVTNKTKKRKFESYPTDPIKTIPLEVKNSSFLEQKKLLPACSMWSFSCGSCGKGRPWSLHKMQKNTANPNLVAKMSQNKKLFEFSWIVDLAQLKSILW